MTMSMVRAFVDVFPQTVLLSGNGAELILMGVNGPRIEIDPGAVGARLAAAPGVRTDLASVSLGTLTEIIGMFVASADALQAAAEPYPPVTDDNAIMEYGLLSQRSQLSRYGVPVQLVHVSRIDRWCPKCFVAGRPIRGLENLLVYLEVLWGDPATVARDERRRAVAAASPYLRRVLPLSVGRSR
jgi:hypothetical protein